MMVPVEVSWQRIEQWLTAHAPQCLAELEPPVSPDDLARAAQVFGELPTDYVGLLRIHNGVDHAQYGTGVFGGFVLRSLASALAAQASWRQAHDDVRREYDVDDGMKAPAGVRQAWWHPGWLPIAIDAGDPRTTVFLDLAPAPGGTRGQLVRHIVDDDHLVVVSGSVGAWLEQIAAAMEAGQVTVARDGEAIVGLDWTDDAGEAVHAR